GAVRGKINPTSVPRPTWHLFAGPFGGEPARRASLRVHNENVCIARSSGIESNLSSVGRPTWRPSHGVEVGQLNQATPVAAAHPDFIGTGARRFEGDFASIRRKLRTTFHSGGIYEPSGRTG